MNLDDTFAYDTPKVVRVRDKYLGIFRLFFMFAIFLYIVVKVIILDKAYDIHDSPSGIASVSLQAPPKIDSSLNPYCPTHPQYETAWPFPGERSLQAPPGLKGYPIACQMWDEHTVTPNDELNAIFVTTRVSTEEQSYHCGTKNTNMDPRVEVVCESPWKTVDQSQAIYFMAGIENYTLGIQHNYFAQSSTFLEDKRFKGKQELRGNSRDREGKIVFPDGSVTKFPAIGKSDLPDIPDIITVGDFLRAANLNLGAQSKDEKNSILYSGVVIICLVKYTNNYGPTHPAAGDVTYEYEVIHVKNSDYKFFQTTELSSTARLLTKRAGPKIFFVVNGDLVKFSFQDLLIQLATAVGLLGVATIIVEFIMLYLMKYRRHYKAAKYEETDDFTALYQGGGSNDGVDSSLAASTNDTGEELIARNEWGSTVGTGRNYSKFR